MWDVHNYFSKSITQNKPLGAEKGAAFFSPIF
jgi:hypothetical protein